MKRCLAGGMKMLTLSLDCRPMVLIRKSGAWSTEVIHIFHKIRDQSNDKSSRERLNEKIRAHAALKASQ